MQLPQDLLSKAYIKPNLYLCETDKTPICRLETTDTSGAFKFNSYSELEFTVGRTYIDMITGETKVNPFYDKIEALRLVNLNGFGYFEIQDPEIASNGLKEEKIITAYSLEYSLSQKYIENLNVNTGELDSVEVIYSEDGKITPVTLYNQSNKHLSLLHIVLEKAYGWSIGHVDASIATMSRTFEISRTSIYDFLMNDICDKFNCYIVFDTINNKINFYAESLITKFIGDGATTSFILTNPYDSLSTVTIDTYKTTAYVYNNETGKITFDTPPANGARIEVTDGSQEQWTTDVYVTFDNLAKEVNISYSADDIKTVLTVKGADDFNIREVNMGLPYIVDLSYYYTVDWMGQDLYDAYTKYLQLCNSKQEQYTSNSKEMLEIDNYIAYETQRLSLQYSIAEVNINTVGTYYIRGGNAPNYYYIEVKLPGDYNANVEHYYTLSGNDLNETKFSNFYKAIQNYFVSGDSKTVTDIDNLAEDFAFMETYTISYLSDALSKATNLDDKNIAINNFLGELWNQLGLTPLKSLYYNPYKELQATNIDAGWNDTSNENYWRYYPVTLVLSSLESAIEIRQGTIDEYNNQYANLQNENSQISNDLLMTNNFTTNQLIRLNAFLREDEYTDDNFAENESDSIETIMQLKQELLECGRIELAKLCEPKLEFSMDMANIYALDEFKPIIHQFQLGNLINVAIRKDYVKKARLLQVNINFEDFSDFSCEFGELTNLRTPSSIHADLLASALTAGKSVASNASYWDRGADLATATDLKIQQGLLDATNGLYSSSQGVIIDKNGIRLTKIINAETGEVSPYQAWLVNNNILFSSDGFQTSNVGLGEFTIDGTTFYGLLAQAVLSGYIEGSTIVGGTINIGNDTFMVDADGNVTINAGTIKGYAQNDNLISSINASPEEIAIDSSKISLTGKDINLTSDNITINSTNFSVTADGQITARNGKIANWTISTNRIYSQNEDGTYNSINTQDGSSFAFAVGAESLSVTTGAPFRVTQAGKLYATDADISGKITAKDGTIAGYNIGSGGCYNNAIYKRVSNNTSDYEVGMKATNGATDLAFYVKESIDDWATNDTTFYIRNNGELYCSNADITGKITASSGEIGGWNIGSLGTYSQSLYSTYCGASSPSTTNPEYAVFMRSYGGPSNIAIGVKKRTSSSTDWTKADNPFYVRKDGFVSMENAYVKGEIYATSGTIDGNLEISGALTHTRGDYKVTLRGVQETLSNGVFYITDSSSGSAKYPVRINGDGSASFTNVSISGDSTIAAACIPDLSASKITSGTISTDRLSSSVITTSNFSAKTLSTGNLTIKTGCTIGSTTYNATIDNRDQYVYIAAAGPTSYGTTIHEIVKQAVTNGSSREIKNEIHDFDDRYDTFFDNLNPQLFKYNFEPNEGYSMGYIWQEAEEARINSNLTRNDIGAIYESGAVTGGLGLRKADFIALNTWQIQKLKARVEELETKFAALEA